MTKLFGQVNCLFLTLGSLLALATPGFAQSGAHVPAYQAPMPNYFSGTNYRAMGEIYPYPPPVGSSGSVSIVDTQLYVGGELVRSWTRGPEDQINYPLSLAVMFDSSRFAANSIIHVRFTGHDNFGRFYDSDIDDPGNDAPNKNWATLYGRYDFEVAYIYKNSAGQFVIPGGPEEQYRALPPARASLLAMSYQIRKQETSLGWSALDLYPYAKECNVLLINSHSNSTFMNSDTNDLWLQYWGQPVTIKNIYGTTVPTGAPADSIGLLTNRIEANGIGLPPFNSTGLPPINIAFMSGCQTAADNQFAEGTLYPYGNVYVGTSEYPEDQACVGFAISFETNGNAGAVHTAFWGALANGRIVAIARDIAYEAYEGSNGGDDPTDFMHVYGDFNARLKRVYTPDGSDAPNKWYRSI